MFLLKGSERLVLIFLVIVLITSCTTNRPTASESAQAFYNLGNAYTELGKNNEAVNAYIRAKQIDPSLISAGFNLARVYIFLNQYENALEQFELLLQEDPKNREVREAKAWALHLQGNDKEAIEIYKSILQDFDSSKNSLYNYAMILSGNENYFEALEIYKKFYDIYSDSKVVYQIGNMYYKLGSLQEAIPWFEKRLEDAPDDLVTIELLGDIFVETKQYLEAVETYNRISEFEEVENQIKGRINFKIAKIYLLKIESLEEGISFLTKAIEANYPKGEYEETLLKVDENWVEQIKKAIEDAEATMDDNKAISNEEDTDDSEKKNNAGAES